MVQAYFRSRSSVVIDDDLAAVMIDVPVMIALFDDYRVAIAVIVAVANHLAFANDFAVTMALTDRCADRTDAHAHFFGECRQCGSGQHPESGSASES